MKGSIFLFLDTTMIESSGQIDKPAIIIGVGRSGSTLLHNVLAYHPNVAWLSSLCNHFPKIGQFNHLLLKAIDLPGVGQDIRDRFHPEEPYDFWEAYSPGFRHPKRDLVASDVTQEIAYQIRGALEQMQTTKRGRWLIKITGWPRIKFLEQIFPDAKFIHLVRDGRAVAHSLLNVDFWRGRQGPEGWRWGALSPELQSKWEEHHRSIVALAGLQWHLLLQAMDEASRDLTSNAFLVIRYEDLCASTVDTVRKIIDFCELPWSKSLSDRTGVMIRESRNIKWQTQLSAEDQYILNDVTRHYREKLGYV